MIVAFRLDGTLSFFFKFVLLICSIYKIYDLTLRAIFSDETGLSCAMKLDDLPVHFSDLFNPLQVPAYFKVSNA